MSYQSNSRSGGFGRYRPIPNYTPLYGLKLYYSESGYILTFIAMAAYALVCINMSAIELAESGNYFCLIGIGSAILLAAGGLLILLSAVFKELPGIIIFFGQLLLFFSALGFLASTVSGLMSEVSLLGIVQGMFELLFLGTLAAALIPMIISCLNRRTSPSLGYLPIVTLLFAALLLLVRTVSTFATLSSALGSDFNWEAASDLSGEVRWVLRSVSTSSRNTSQMYYARLFERVVLIILYFSALPTVFRFPSFFKEYNMQMDISAELPGHEPQISRSDRKRQKREKDEEKGSDLLAGLSSLRSRPDAVNTPPEDEEEPEDIINDNSYSGPDFISGFDEPDEYDYRPPIRRPVKQPTGKQKPREPQIIYNTQLLAADYGKPCDPKEIAEDAEQDENEQPERNSETGAYKVKLKSSIPNPADKSIWDNYTE